VNIRVHSLYKILAVKFVLDFDFLASDKMNGNGVLAELDDVGNAIQIHSVMFSINGDVYESHGFPFGALMEGQRLSARIAIVVSQ
jgi:hypothetical protein